MTTTEEHLKRIEDSLKLIGANAALESLTALRSTIAELEKDAARQLEACVAAVEIVAADPSEARLIGGSIGAPLRQLAEQIAALTQAQAGSPARVPVEASDSGKSGVNLNALRDLKAGWNSYDAPPIDERAIAVAEAILSTPGTATPSGGGGVQIEWHCGGVDLEFGIGPDGRIEECECGVPICATNSKDESPEGLPKPGSPLREPVEPSEAANRESDAYAPNPATLYLCPYCNGSARLRDTGTAIDAYRNVCHVACLERVASAVMVMPISGTASAPLPNPHIPGDEAQAPNGLSGVGGCPTNPKGESDEGLPK